MKLSRIIKSLKRCYAIISNTEFLIRTQIKIERYTELSLCSDVIGITDKQYCDYPVIVTLTSYGNKIQQVGLAIESLMHQTIKPNKIVLCLSEEFEGKLPIVLEHQRERGLEILFCKDIRSYTKLIPTLRKYPQSIIISIDDDIIYPVDFVEYLIMAYNNNPKKVYFYYGHTITLDRKGQVIPYKEWIRRPAKGSSIFNLPTGVDGILYPPGCFHEDICKEKLFMELCPYADDLWFKAMTLLKGVECEQVERVEDVKRDFVHLDAADRFALSTINNGKNMNDVQWNRLWEKYELWKCLN